MSLSAHNVTWNRGGTLVVNQVTLSPKPGSTIGLLGPNGCGKSSLLSLLYGAHKPTDGRVLLNDTELFDIPRKTRARSVAVVSQHADTDVAVRVIDVVRLGRIPYRTAFGSDLEADEKAVTSALAATDMTALAEREWHRLSGGERQRAHIARALAQEPTELLLDEPTNHLDIKHQLELLRLVTKLPVTSVIALHDLNLAAAFCDELLVMKAGEVIATGTPTEVLTKDLIREVYGVEAEVGSIAAEDGSDQVTVLYRG